MTHPVTAAGTAALATLTNPGSKPPPGSQKVLDVLSWTSWTFGVVAVVGFIGVGITLILAFNDRGPGSGHVSGLGRVLFGCIIGAAAFLLAGWATT